MKINKILLGTFAMMLALASCEDDRLVEMPPVDVLLEDAIQTEEDLKMASIGMYQEFSSGDSFGADIIMFGDLISDNVFVSQTNNGYFVTTQNMSWSGDNAGDFAQLNELYDAVAMANLTINGGAKLEQTENVKNLLGEAHIGRALAFFTLVNFYSATPTSGLHQDYGIPIYTGEYDPNGKYPRETVANTYAQIISDLEAALSLMTNTTPANKGFFTPTVANYLLSKVYLTRGAAGDYQKSLDYSNIVLNNSPAAYSLLNATDAASYAAYFNSPDIALSENREETIWEINFTVTDNPGLNAALGAFYSNTGVQRSILARQSLYDSYASTDIRKGNAIFRTTGTPDSDDPKGVWVLKWPRNNSEGNFANNIRVFRMTEVLFNKWEAMYHLGQQGQALTELNQFATSRGGNTYSGDVLKAILDEKRKEFVGEGYRFFDLKRNGLGIDKNTNCFGNSCNVPANDRLFVIPMSRAEMNLNTNMTQYPEW